jgi:hypothetical protein
MTLATGRLYHRLMTEVKQISFDLGRLRPGDLIAGAASFLVFISVFLPWYSFAADATQSTANATLAQQQLVLAICIDQPVVCSSNVPPQFSVSALGGGAGGWRFLILVTAVVVVLYVLSRTLDVVAQAVPIHWQLLVGVTAFQGLLVIIGFAANPLDLLNGLGSSSWSVGAFLALIAALTAVGGAVLVMRDPAKQSAASLPFPNGAGN